MKEVSKTAFYCCGCRMEDAASEYPIVGDFYAQQLMGKEGMKYWKTFEGEEKSIASSQARHYLVENALRKHLHHNPDATIIHLGAGLDTRPFRMHGGNWVEIDNAEILAYKESRLPAANCRNPLQSISIDFEKESLAEKLAPFTNHPDVIFVVEGVLIYLTQAQRVEQLGTLTKLFPRHHYICDLMNRQFFEKLVEDSFHEKIMAHGTSFVDMQEDPTDIFRQAGYREMSKASTIDTARHLGRYGGQSFLIGLLPQKIRDGYRVYEFAFGK